MAELSVSSANQLLSSDRRSSKRRGMEMLCVLGRQDLVLQYALDERDMRILEVVAKVLQPNPPELERHMSKTLRGIDTTALIGYGLAYSNYLYAENVIFSAYRSRKLLTLDWIETAGLSYMRSLSPLLVKYLSGSMINYSDAFVRYGQKAVSGVRKFVDSDGTNCWSRESEAAIQSAMALTRLDVDFDLQEVHRMLKEVPSAMSRKNGAPTIARLKWILFDKGVLTDWDEMLGLIADRRASLEPDLATTLLKKGEKKRLEQLVSRVANNEDDRSSYVGVYLVKPYFCYWPLINWLEANKMFDGAANKRNMEHYIEAREEVFDPPPWWIWRCCNLRKTNSPVSLDPRWLSSTVLDLARTIYDERVYERMPILADALMDAGCDSEEILSHCRSGGPHVRGCWVISLLLGEE